MKKVANIIEVGLRDGLQSHPRTLSSFEKFNIINRLVKANFKQLEIASFVNPKLVPQLADSKHISSNVTRYTDVVYSALVPNIKGYHEMKMTKNIDEIVLFVSTSETFNKKNINSNIDEAFKKFEEISKLAHRDGIKIRGSVSCIFDCPYEGYKNKEETVDIVRRYLDIGVDRIDLADTIGSGKPLRMGILLNELDKVISINRLTGHFHDTFHGKDTEGTALSLVDVCLNSGMNTFHGSINGLGGCPFSNKIVGNLSTEKLIDYLHLRGYSTGIDVHELNKIKINYLDKNNEIKLFGQSGVGC